MSGSMSKVVQAKLQSASPIDLVNDEARVTWESFRAEQADAYDARILAFAEDWARLMQLEIAAGKRLADVANTTKREANYDGMTVTMVAAAVAKLARCWRYGSELLLWHNARFEPWPEAQRLAGLGRIVVPSAIDVDN